MANTTENEYLLRVVLKDIVQSLQVDIFPTVIMAARQPCVCREIGMIPGQCGYCQAKTYLNCLVTALQLEGFRG